MYYSIGIALVILTIAVHEAGHAYCMHRRGVEIKVMGIGIPIWKFKLTLHPRWLPFPLVLSPLLLGAYVWPTDAGDRWLKELDYDDQAACYGAGVFMNIVFGALLVAGLSVARLMDPVRNHQDVLTLLLIVVGVTALMVIFRKWFFRLVPFFGLLAALFVVYALVSSPEETGGPVTVAKMVANSKDLTDAVLFAANISLSLALFNMVPLVPLDGGRTFKALLERTRLAKFSDVYATAGVFVMLGLFGYLIVTDFM